MFVFLPQSMFGLRARKEFVALASWLWWRDSKTDEINLISVEKQSDTSFYGETKKKLFNLPETFEILRKMNMFYSLPSGKVSRDCSSLCIWKLKTCYRVGSIRSICLQLQGDLNDPRFVPQHKLAHFPEIFPERPFNKLLFVRFNLL